MENISESSHLENPKRDMRAILRLILQKEDLGWELRKEKSESSSLAGFCISGVEFPDSVIRKLFEYYEGMQERISSLFL